jgi:hypothetical protein
MSGLLGTSRIPILLVPDHLIVEAARDEDVPLDRLKPTPGDRAVVLDDSEPARRVLRNAIERSRELAPGWTRLAFAMQHQCQSEWCWAATTVSVSAFYDPHTSWTQCGLVNAEKGLTTCCSNGSSDDCNMPHRLDRSLKRASVLDHKQDGPAGSDVIRQEITAGRPLALRVGWESEGGHFAAIVGFKSAGEQWVAIADPWFGAWDGPVSTLTRGKYQGSGTWSDTYFTRPQPIQPQVLREIRLPREILERVPATESPPVPGGE